MFAFTYAAGVLASIYAVCGAVFLSRRASPLSLALGWYALSASVWIAGNAAADVAYADTFLIAASGIAFIGGAANLFCFLVLIDTLIDGRFPPKRRLAVFALPSTACSLFAFSTYAIADFSFPVGSPAVITPGPLYALSLFFLLCGFSYGAARFVAAIHAAETRANRMQLSYCFAGLLMMLAGEVLFDVVLPVLGEVRFYTLGPMASAAFILSCGYAIFRHRLIDLKLIVRMLEEKVEARTRQLRSLQEEQRAMIADLSHNLQTPLAILKSKLERLDRAVVRDGDYASLERSVDQLSSFVADLLALSTLDDALRIEGNSPFSLSRLLEEIAEEIGVIADDAGIRCETAIAPGFVCVGNEKRVREAVMNVASNAVKYIGDGPEKRIALALARSGPDAAITVTDTGIGIPESELEAVRTRFYRGSAHAYGSRPGSGLGLAFAERIARGMGGSLMVRSAPGSGSTFTFTLPLERKGGS